MALQSALESSLKRKDTTAKDLVLINHIDVISADNTVNVDVSIPTVGVNIAHNMPQEDYLNAMKDGFNGLGKAVLTDLNNSIELLLKSM